MKIKDITIITIARIIMAIELILRVIDIRYNKKYLIQQFNKISTE